jgi:hypothetical protein
MIRKVVLLLVLVLVATATTALACGTTRRARAAMTSPSDPILLTYEKARLALITGSVADAEKAASEIASAASSAGENAIFARAEEMRNATDLVAARQGFAALSDEVIKYYEKSGGDQLAIAYCAMEKKSWLQPGGKITNPYVGDEMRHCGEFADDETAPTHHSGTHHR